MRKRCPFCKRPVRLRRDGTLYKHGKTFTPREWPNAAYGQNQCPGSWQFPIEAVDAKGKSVTELWEFVNKNQRRWERE